MKRRRVYFLAQNGDGSYISGAIVHYQPILSSPDREAAHRFGSERAIVSSVGGHAAMMNAVKVVERVDITFEKPKPLKALFEKMCEDGSLD